MTNYKEELKALQTALKDENAKALFQDMINQELSKILSKEDMQDNEKMIEASQQVLLKILKSTSNVISKGQ